MTRETHRSSRAVAEFARIRACVASRGSPEVWRLRLQRITASPRGKASFVALRRMSVARLLPGYLPDARRIRRRAASLVFPTQSVGTRTAGVYTESSRWVFDQT